MAFKTSYRLDRSISSMFFIYPPRDGVIADVAEPDERSGYILFDDIAAVAAIAFN